MYEMFNDTDVSVMRGQEKRFQDKDYILRSSVQWKRRVES